MSALIKTKKDKLRFKQLLKDFCMQELEEHLREATASRDRAQEAVKNEEKNTMGDKYETSRAMGHIDSDRAALQMLEAKKQQAALQLIDAAVLHDSVQAGSVVITDAVIYFIAVAIGSRTIENNTVHIISPRAPIAGKLMGLATGDTVEFNGKTIAIKNVF